MKELSLMQLRKLKKLLLETEDLLFECKKTINDLTINELDIKNFTQEIERRKIQNQNGKSK